MPKLTLTEWKQKMLEQAKKALEEIKEVQQRVKKKGYHTVYEQSRVRHAMFDIGETKGYFRALIDELGGSEKAQLKNKELCDTEEEIRNILMQALTIAYETFGW